MAFKFVIISCLVAMVRAGNIPAAVVSSPALVAAPAQIARLEEFDDTNYKFEYTVGDSITGDYKSQVESRNGDLVQGQYSLIEPNGEERIVDYFADANGFNAIVRKGNKLVVAPAVVPEPAYVADPAVGPARITAAPVAPAPIPYPSALAAYATYPSTLDRYTAYQPFARFAARPFTYPAPAPVVAV